MQTNPKQGREDCLDDCYETVSEELDRVGAPLDAAEAQGVLMGLFASKGAVSERGWLAELIPENHKPGRFAQPGIKALHARLVRQLASGDNMGVDLCLPEDGVPFDERLEALRNWCQGYLYGFGAGGGSAPDKLPPDAREVFEDITEIGQLQADDSQSEANEQALMELVEYLRVGVAVVHLALHPGVDLPDPGQRLH